MWSKRYFQFSILCAKEERAQHHHFYKAYPACSGDLLLSYLQHTYICSRSHTSTNILHSCLICVPILMYLTVSLRMRMIFGTSYLYLEGHTTDRLVEPFGSCKTLVLPCRPPHPKTLFQTASPWTPRVLLHTTCMFYLYVSLSWTRFGPIVWEQHHRMKTKSSTEGKKNPEIVRTWINLHTLLIPFTGDVRAQEYICLKTMTHIERHLYRFKKNVEFTGSVHQVDCQKNKIKKKDKRRKRKKKCKYSMSVPPPHLFSFLSSASFRT